MRLRSGALRCVCLGAILACSNSATAAQQQRDLSGIWTRGPAAQSYFRPPDSGPGPVRNLTPPRADAGGGAGTRNTGDHTSPILQPWAAEVVKRHADAERANRPIPTAQVLCRPHGVPQVLELNDAVQFLQTPDLFLILYSREMRPRLVYLNAAHPRDLKSSSYGHSIGHWDGDTLVVDTVGLAEGTWIDRLGTPHTERLHVVERYRRIGDTIRVDVTVEDPGAFTTPWSAIASYRPQQDGAYHEQVCAENNIDTLTGRPQAIPTDQTPDF